MTATTKITGLNASHIRMAAAAGLMIAKQGKSVLEIAASPADALTTLDAVKANVVKDRGDANLFGTLRRKIVAAVPTVTDEPTTAEPVVTDADAEAVMVANADAEPAGVYYVETDDAAATFVDPATNEPVADAAPAPKKARARKAKAVGNTADAPAEGAAVDNTARAGIKGLKGQTLAWHAANPTTPAKAEELKKIFGAKWAGPIRIHQRNLADDGVLVRVGDTKPEVYRLADNAGESA